MKLETLLGKEKMLDSVWSQQAQYNEGVFERQKRSPSEWMETYILGLLSEAGQLLDSMRWKKHKLESLKDFGPNVPNELADLTKYVFSMWQLMGYSPEAMLEQVYEKGELLTLLHQQDFRYELKHKVIIFDLDDVLADLRGSLTPYLMKRLGKATNGNGNIHLDLENSWEFDRYREAKFDWEQEGGYATLQPLMDIGYLFSILKVRDFSIVVYTARPANVIKRVQADTYQWFKKQGVLPDMLKFGREERIAYASKLSKQGHEVLLVDDNPDTLQRADLCGINTLAVSQCYNDGIDLASFLPAILRAYGYGGA